MELPGIVGNFKTNVFDKVRKLADFLMVMNLPDLKLNTKSTIDEELFDGYLNTERIELAKGLAGEENMNFEYTEKEKKEIISKNGGKAQV